MILEAINNKISGICKCYPLMGDIEATAPYAVFFADQSALRDKTGIIAYSYDVKITVVDPDIDNCMLISSGIKVAVNALIDSTTQGTTFDLVQITGESQRYDSVAFNYINDLSYKILTQNE